MRVSAHLSDTDRREQWRPLQSHGRRSTRSPGDRHARPARNPSIKRISGLAKWSKPLNSMVSCLYDSVSLSHFFPLSSHTHSLSLSLAFHALKFLPFHFPFHCYVFICGRIVHSLFFCFFFFPLLPGGCVSLLVFSGLLVF